MAKHEVIVEHGFNRVLIVQSLWSSHGEDATPAEQHDRGLGASR